ncbi:DgyrCDS9404 [Dimorphilus gyrociliatus]|uniref:DgyrCDS9404 n=1 Tax=Dimorphilus gyrociliatus TaxID=2664684 RepID=A0A7I8VZK4_9ANNE|nr:DgyrCDS9404 [Dimorphilus gyrociliatus]
MREGLYIKIPFISSHHRPAYKHHNATWFIYHLSPNKWVVGQKIGVRRSSVVIKHSAKYPHLVMGNWSIYNSIKKQWRNTINLEVVCEDIQIVKDIYTKRKPLPEEFSSVNCSFNQPSICGYTIISNDKFTWKWSNVGTPSSHTGAPTGSSLKCPDPFVYTEASLGSFNDETKLVSSFYKPIQENYCLRFNYHVYGDHIGKLLVKLDCHKKTNILLRITGNFGNEWKLFMDNVTHQVNDQCRILFVVLRGHGIRGDISIDEISLLPGYCPIKQMESLACDFTDKDLCGYVPKPGLLTWNSQFDPETGLEKLLVNSKLAWSISGQKAYLLSPYFNFKSKNSCLRITYLLDGSAYLKLNNFEKKTLWSVKGDKGNAINHAYIEINDKKNRFELEAGSFGIIKRIELIETFVYTGKSCKNVKKACPDNYWQCTHFHECIPRKQICDSIINCYDKSDEYHCKTPCSAIRIKEPVTIEGLFKLHKIIGELVVYQSATSSLFKYEFYKNGTACWSLNDKIIECKRRSLNRTICHYCQPNEYQCENSMKCIDKRLVCNGDYDCGYKDLSDEEKCPCGEDEFTCSDGKCIPLEQRCDGFYDCLDDERNCTIKECDKYQWKCSTGFCIAISQRCDGTDDCDDSSDESECALLDRNNTLMYEKPEPLPVCSEGWSAAFGEVACAQVGGIYRSMKFMEYKGEIKRFLMLQQYLAGTNVQNFSAISTKYMQGILIETPYCPYNKVITLDCRRDLQSSCGRKSTKENQIASYIIGSFESETNAWPWSAHLQIKTRKCGATVVKDRWVLTAAHCVSNNDPKQIQIRLGNSALFRTDSFKSGVKRIIVHPNYERNKFPINDLALLESEKPLNVTPICLPKIDSVFQGRKNCFIAGWGRTIAEEKSSKPIRLREAHMHVWMNEKCELFYTKNGFINSSLYYCGGYESGKISSCLGDSGSPLMCPSKHNTWELAGVTSFSSSLKCSQPGSPSVFVKVNTYLKWILGIINV